MGFFNKYPYTDFHELNLDWLLAHYQDLVHSLADIHNKLAAHEIEYEDAIKELERVSNEIDQFESDVNAAFNSLKNDLEQELSDSITAMNRTMNIELNKMRSDVQAAIDSINAQYEQLQLNINNQIAQFKVYINKEILYLKGYIDANNELLYAWVENAFEEFIRSLPDLQNVQVYNPYRGYITDLQTAINDIYNIACIYGLTAQQYDNLGLTAQEYDDYDLTAFEYDAWGYKLLNYPDPDYYMISPFTGEYTLVKDVVLRLAYFHMEGLTAEEYDNKELTASEYDALLITAFDYDWFGEQLLA